MIAGICIAHPVANSRGAQNLRLLAWAGRPAYWHASVLCQAGGSIGFAYEPSGPVAMLRPPPARGAPLLSGSLLLHIVLVSLLFLGGVYGI